MKKLKLLNLLFVLTVFCCPLAVLADEGKDESGKGKRPKAQHHYGGSDESYFKNHGYGHLDIPKGHYPPPGECRIWYPDRPAGHQPPPGNCRRLRREVPPGAWLIYHPEDDRKHAHISVYDEQQPGGFGIMGVFEIDTGAFIREIREN